MKKISFIKSLFIFLASTIIVSSGVTDQIKINESTGALNIAGNESFIQVFTTGWKQLKYCGKVTRTSSGNPGETKEEIIGSVGDETLRVDFSESLTSTPNAIDVNIVLKSEKEFYAYGVYYTLSLIPSQYSGSVITFDGQPVRLPQKGDKGVDLPNSRKVKRIVISNSQTTYVLSGEFTASIITLPWAYQLRLHFTPFKGNMSSAAIKFRIDIGDKTLSADERKTITSPSDITFVPNEKWKPINTSEIQVKTGSPLDLSVIADLYGAPAGKFGRVIAKSDGSMAFEKKPDMPVRFFGFNWIFGRDVFSVKTPDTEALKNIELFCDLAKRQGYNIIRMHCLDSGLMTGSTEGDFKVPERNWQRFDHLVKCLKERGIYLYIDLAIVGYYNGGWTPSARKNLRDRMYFGDKADLDHWRTGAMMVLNHINRYSGIALKDDPIVACVLFYNEQDLSTMPWQGYRKERNIPWQNAFQKWLKDKYGNIDQLKVAWNNQTSANVKDFNDITFNGTELVPHGTMRNDMSHFYRDMQQKLMAFYKEVMVECGYKGLTTQYDSTKNIRGTAMRNDVEVISMHDYGAHPNNSIRPGSQIGVGSTISGSMWYWRSINQTKYLNKPMMVTEYAQGFWNPYSHEAGLAFAAYSAFQNFSAIMAHSDAVALKLEKPMDEFSQSRSPIFRANEFLAAHLFLRGDVKPAKTKLEVAINGVQAFIDGQAEDALNSNQSTLALVTGFGISYLPKGIPVSGPKVDVVMQPRRGGAQIVNTEFTSTAIDHNNNIDDENSQIIEKLKVQKAIGKDNLTNFKKQIYHSDTGEIYMDSGKSLLTVITPKTEGATFINKEAVTLDFLNVVSSSTPAMVALTSIDNLPLKQSSRMVLIYSTNAVNSKMKVSQDLSTLYSQGNLPVLVECGKLDLSLNSANSAELWALALDGTRTEKLPVISKDGKSLISIDTAKLKAGPTPFFELTWQAQQ